MVNWVGILDGFEKHEAREERKDNKAFKERQEARLEDELNESKFLRRSKTLLEYLDGRGSSIKVDTGKLVELKTLLGDIPGANDYLAKLKASPYALDAVYSALQKRSNNVGIPTGQELMDNITLIAENYGSESWMQQYTEGRDILETITAQIQANSFVADASTNAEGKTFRDRIAHLASCHFELRNT